MNRAYDMSPSGDEPASAAGSTDDELRKVYVTQNDTVSLVCPRCKKEMLLGCSDFKEADGPIKITHGCSCGSSNMMILERRGELRRSVRLSGAYASDERGRKQPLQVKDLSRSGLRFQTLLGQRFETGEPLLVEFHLDDEDRSLIQRSAVVRDVRGTDVGIQFMEGDRPHRSNGGDRVLSLYVKAEEVEKPTKP